MWKYEKHTTKEMSKENITKLTLCNSLTGAFIWSQIFGIDEGRNEKKVYVRNPFRPERWQEDTERRIINIM